MDNKDKTKICELLTGAKLLLLQTDTPHVNQSEILEVLDEIEALMRKGHACGNFECKVSIGIHEGYTFGSSELDGLGYWEIPCYECARAFEIIHPGDKAWPFKKGE